MVARRVLLLVAALVFLVNDNQTQGPERRKQRGASADIAEGRVQEFANVDDLMASLRAARDPGA